MTIYKNNINSHLSEVIFKNLQNREERFRAVLYIYIRVLFRQNYLPK